MVDVVRFRRSVWSSTVDAGDERNDCTIWSGPAADVGRLILRMHLAGPEVGHVRVTPQALVSNDGTAWSPAGWLGSAPSAVVDRAPRQLGPFEVDPAHGKRFLRITLTTESIASGLVMGSVVGTLHLVGP